MILGEDVLYILCSRPVVYTLRFLVADHLQYHVNLMLPSFTLVTAR